MFEVDVRVPVQETVSYLVKSGQRVRFQLEDSPKYLEWKVLSAANGVLVVQDPETPTQVRVMDSLDKTVDGLELKEFEVRVRDVMQTVKFDDTEANPFYYESYRTVHRSQKKAVEVGDHLEVNVEDDNYFNAEVVMVTEDQLVLQLEDGEFWRHSSQSNEKLAEQLVLVNRFGQGHTQEGFRVEATVEHKES